MHNYEDFFILYIQNFFVSVSDKQFIFKYVYRKLFEKAYNIHAGQKSFDQKP